MDKFRANNHFVPEGFLRNWCNTNNKLWRYEILVPHKNVPAWKESSPKAIAKHKHLYTRLIAGEESDDIERWFDSEFESLAIPVITKALKHQKLSEEDFLKLIKFVAAQDVRTPARMVEILKRGEESVPEILQDIAENFEDDYKNHQLSNQQNVAKVNDYSNILPIRINTEPILGTNNAGLKIETIVGKSYYLYTVKYLLNNTIQHLLNHNWTFLRAHPDIIFPTSDDPVIKLNYFDENNYNFDGGWGSQGTELILPLSPNIILYTKIGYKAPSKYSSFNLKQSQLIQKIIIEHAHRTVFCNEKLPTIHQLRPRKVDLDIYNHEKESWLNWHNQNTLAEKLL